MLSHRVPATGSANLRCANRLGLAAKNSRLRLAPADKVIAPPASLPTSRLPVRPKESSLETPPFQ